MTCLAPYDLGCGLWPAGVSRGHDTHWLHAMAPGLVGQTVERARDIQRMQSPWRPPAKAKPVRCG